MPKTTTREHDRLRRVAREYKRQGYDVVLQPSNDHLPEFLKGFQPDLVAYGLGENVVVEVKTRSSLAAATELPDIAKQIEDRPGWRFDLILTNPKRQTCVPQEAVLPAFDEIVKRLTIARELVQKNALNSAMLLAWTSLEGVLRLLSHDEVPGLESQGPERLLKELYALGLLTKQSYDRLQGSITLRHALVHGYSVTTLKPANVMRLIEEAESLLEYCQEVVSQKTCSSGGIPEACG